MARNHARVVTAIWSDDDFTALSPGAQRLYLLLLSQPDLSPCGVLPYLPRRWARLAAGTTVTDIEQAAAELSEGTYIVVDDVTEEVAIRTFVLHDAGLNNLKMRGAIRSSLKAVHSRLLRSLIAELIPDEWRAEIVDGIDVRSPIPTGSGSTFLQLETSDAEVGVGIGGTGSLPDQDLGCVAAAPPDPQGHRIRVPFTVPAEWISWAEENVPGLDWDAETKKFVDHFRAKSGKDARKVDWFAAWRNWMRGSAEGKFR